MSGMADEMKIDIPCPECGKQISESLARLKDDPTLTCPACGMNIHVKADASLKDAADAIDDFDRAIRDFGKL